MKKATIWLAVLLCLTLVSCGETAQDPETSTDETVVSNETSLPEGVTQDDNGNFVYTLTNENWMEYFEFAPKMLPESLNANGEITDFYGCSEFRIKEEYKDRLVDCNFGFCYRPMKTVGHLLTYNAETAVTTAAMCSEAEWAEMKLPFEYSNEYAKQEQYIGVNKDSFKNGTTGDLVEDRVTLYEHFIPQTEDHKVYTLPAAVPVEYAVYQVEGTFILKG